ncbi:MAG: hypothetical protein GY870_19440, partial [archaeon]|nr:hypothetical protein [archaeon]
MDFENMNFEKITEKLMKLLEDTEEITLKNVELVGDSLEFQILPQIAQGTAIGARQMLNQFAGMQPSVMQGRLTSAEWIETKFPEVLSDNTGKIEEITFSRKGGKKVVVGGEIVPPYLTIFGKKNP